MVLDGEEYTFYIRNLETDELSEALSDQDVAFVQASIQLLISMERMPHGELQAHFNGGMLLWSMEPETGEWVWQ